MHQAHDPARSVARDSARNMTTLVHSDRAHVQVGNGQACSSEGVQSDNQFVGRNDDLTFVKPELWVFLSKSSECKGGALNINKAPVFVIPAAEHVDDMWTADTCRSLTRRNQLIPVIGVAEGYGDFSFKPSSVAHERLHGFHPSENGLEVNICRPIRARLKDY